MDEPKKPKGYSPVNGQPIPEGKPFRAGDGRAREMQKRSTEARMARLTLREELLRLLEESIPDGKNGKIKTQKAISSAIVREAIQGNVKAFETIRDTIGEKPLEKIVINTPEPETISNVESALFGEDGL